MLRLIALASALVAVAVCNECPAGFDLVNNSCYKVNNFRVNWSEAWFFCLGMHSHLADIETAEEQTALAEYLGSEQFKGNWPLYWIDASDLLVEGEWRWMLYNSSVEFTKWIQGQPDNGRGAHNEHCAHLNGRWGFGWNDHQCIAQLNFLCETAPGAQGTHPKKFIKTGRTSACQ